MYHFPDLDEQTRLNMLSELEFDILTGLFYEPVSMTASGMMGCVSGMPAMAKAVANV